MFIPPVVTTITWLRPLLGWLASVRGGAEQGKSPLSLLLGRLEGRGGTEGSSDTPHQCPVIKPYIVNISCSCFTANVWVFIMTYTLIYKLNTPVHIRHITCRSRVSSAHQMLLQTTHVAHTPTYLKGERRIIPKLYI